MVKQDQNGSNHHFKEKIKGQEPFSRTFPLNKKNEKNEDEIDLNKTQMNESQDEKRKKTTDEKHPWKDFDRNEGEGRSQKS